MSNSYRGYALALIVDVWEIGTVLAAVISSGTSLPARLLALGNLGCRVGPFKHAGPNLGAQRSGLGRPLDWQSLNLP